MKKISVCLLSLIMVAPTFAQQSAPSQNETPVLSGPLTVLPEDVQNAALEDAANARDNVPSGLNPIEEAFYRAQNAFANEDWISARNYAEIAALGGNADAALLAGLIARDGIDGSEPDTAAASAWFRRAAQQNHPTAMYQLGILAGLGVDELGLGTARNWYSRAARAGNVEAMIAFGHELKASANPQDPITARTWMERAALAGAPEGMYQIGQMLDVGEGGAIDIPGALNWYQLAADRGHPEASLQAAMVLKEGDASEEDLVQSLGYMRIAAESGFVPAMSRLGLLLIRMNPEGEERTHAANWFAEGARLGDYESQFLYAYVLAHGIGLDANLEESYFWILLAGTDEFGFEQSNESREQLQFELERTLTSDVLMTVRARVNEVR